MERFFMGSRRSRYKFDSDIDGWNQLDWQRDAGIIGCGNRSYMGSRIVSMGSGR
jgi:hypothetical protein